MTTTTADIANVFGRSARSVRSRRLWRRRLMRRAFLSEVLANDWIALGLLAWMLAMVGWSVELANWGDLPSIVPTSLIAAALAFFMCKVRLPSTSIRLDNGSIINDAFPVQSK